MGDKDKKIFNFSMNNRRLSIIIFSLFSSWLLAIPFEGRILYALLDYYNVAAQPFILGSMIVHCLGLISCSFFVKTMRASKKMILLSIVFCFFSSIVFLFPPTLLWQISLFSSSFFIGCSVAAWSFFFKSETPKSERIKTIADALIFCYILTILLDKTAISISPQVALILSMILLSLAFLFSLKLPEKEHIHSPAPQLNNPVSIAKPLALLCLFIVISSLNVGLMFHVQYPAFVEHKDLNSWFWAVPYIVAVLIVRNLPNKINRIYTLYFGIAMTGFSFIAFILMDRSVISYLVVDTLMVGAFGIFNLFWWTILGEMLSLHNNPARVLGIGLSANVFGAFLGALIGNTDIFSNLQNTNTTLLSLGVVCVTLAILPMLYSRLTVLLKTHAYMVTLYEMPPQEQKHLIYKSAAGDLTAREAEIAALLAIGKTYKSIAAELHVSENTVRTHVKNIYSKYDVQNRVELINAMMETKSPPSVQ